MEELVVLLQHACMDTGLDSCNLHDTEASLCVMLEIKSDLRNLPWQLVFHRRQATSS